MSIFAAQYISKGGRTRLYATGFFYARLQTICGSVPPCRALMRRLPLDRCIATGKAEPFFIFHQNKQLYAMQSAIQNCLNVNNSIPATSAHETCAKFIEFVRERYPNLNSLKYKISRNGKSLSLRARYKRRAIHAYGLDFEKTINTFMFYLILKLSIDKYYPTVAEWKEKRALEPFYVKFYVSIYQTINNN